MGTTAPESGPPCPPRASRLKSRQLGTVLHQEAHAGQEGHKELDKTEDGDTNVECAISRKREPWSALGGERASALNSKSKGILRPSL